ncbi:unnamed protein product [Victoria cruziana]
MGSSLSNGNEIEGENEEVNHLKLLASVIPSEDSARMSLIHAYKHTLRGFAAMLTTKEADILSKSPGIVSVFPDPVLKLHTTRSWDFLQVESGEVGAKAVRPPVDGDVIIGMIDTGIWPESPSFNDAGLGPIPSRWKGTCMEGPDFKVSNCNRKVIGARYYNSFGIARDPESNRTNMLTSSPRDTVGHGSHTASTAAGSIVHNASYYGLGLGTARGGSPTSRLAIYKACSEEGCSGADLLKGIDDAVRDGVDIISISIGISSVFQMDFVSDPIAIGAFHATQRGVLVVCSGGNDGPFAFSVVNSAPWIFTVGASTIDRDFQSTVALRNGQTFQGPAISFSKLNHSRLWPLVFAGDIPVSPSSRDEARNCYPGSLNAAKTARKIVVCLEDDPIVTRKVKKLAVESLGARGMIFVDQQSKSSAFDAGDFPFVEVNTSVGNQILAYINSTRKPRATILSSVGVPGVKPAPVVAYFSSRGPGGLTQSILKPDVVAPGVNILASVIPTNMTGKVPAGKKASVFAIKSGTSMACPHVTGAAASIKAAHPRWSSSMIKSALMTTASTVNNLGKQVTNTSGMSTTPLDTGSGEIHPTRALDPGLVYETHPHDYFNFLCYYGYSQAQISSISGTNYSCPSNSSESLISNLNYPSITISKLGRQNSTTRRVSRTLTNVGPSVDATYTVTVETSNSLSVEVRPQKLIFSANATSLSYDAEFSVKGAGAGYQFGSITWSDGAHVVRTTFAVNVV